MLNSTTKWLEDNVNSLGQKFNEKFGFYYSNFSLKYKDKGNLVNLMKVYNSCISSDSCLELANLMKVDYIEQFGRYYHAGDIVLYEFVNLVNLSFKYNVPLVHLRLAGVAMSTIGLVLKDIDICNKEVK